MNEKNNVENLIKSKFDAFPSFLKEPPIVMKIILCAICLGMLYHSIFISLIYDWIHLPDFSHGFFIPFISLYFVWERRNQLDQLPAAPANSGIFVILFGFLLLLIGNLASESFTMRFSFLIVLSGLILFLLGWLHLKALFFPIAFLIFMIPIPSILLQKITFPMQLFASNMAEFSLKALGIPALREGNIIHLSTTTLEVAEACSGIRSLISLLALGTVFAYFSKKIFWERAVLILACFPIAILVNALRVSTTGVLANYYGMSVAEGFFHGFSGYVLFLVAFALLLLLGLVLSRLRLYLRTK
jgi:exosortase